MQVSRDSTTIILERGSTKLTGPVKGPRLKRAMATGRASIRVMSAIVAPPRAIGVPPMKPEMKRNTMNWASVLLTAQPTRKTRNRAFET